MIISVRCPPLSGLEWNSVLVCARIWYQTNPVPDLHDTPPGDIRPQNRVDLLHRFLEHVSFVLVGPAHAWPGN